MKKILFKKNLIWKTTKREQVENLQQDIRSYRFNFDLFVDVYFKALEDERFSDQLKALGLGAVLEITTSLTYRDYTLSFSTLNFTRLSKLFTFQKKILKFVKTHNELITRYQTILTSLILF